MRILALASALVLAGAVAPIASAEDTGSAPAALAPAASPGDASLLTTQLSDVRRDVLAAQRELQKVNAEVARASHRNVSPSQLERLAGRRERAQREFDNARERVPGLIAQARDAGMSASVLRAYEHSLQGE